MVATRTHTVDDLERTPPPGDWSVNDWELVDGELIVVTPTGGESDRLSAKVIYLVGVVVHPRRLGNIYGSDAGFKLFPDRETVLAPDVSFVRADRVPPLEEERRFLRLAPDFAVEVRSPSDNWAPLLTKSAMYLDAGVRLVWLIDPTHRTVTVLTPDASPVTLHEGETLDGGDVLPGFAAPVAEIFA
jgi:Uma2 family endonuclease